MKPNILEKDSTIPEQTLPEGRPFGVFIEQIKGPYEFYVHSIEGPDEKTLTMRLNQFYNDLLPDCYRIDSLNDIPGTYVAALNENCDWKRGVIQEMVSPDQVKVFYVDVGAVETVTTQNIRHLDKIFSDPPKLVTRVAFSGVRGTENDKWSIEARKFFYKMMVAGMRREPRGFVAQIAKSKKDESDSTTYLQLIDTSDESKDVVINEVMLQMGLCEKEPVVEDTKKKDENAKEVSSNTKMENFQRWNEEVDEIPDQYYDDQKGDYINSWLMSLKDPFDPIIEFNNII